MYKIDITLLIYIIYIHDFRMDAALPIADEPISLVCDAERGDGRSIISTLRNGIDSIVESFTHHLFQYFTKADMSELNLVCKEMHESATTYEELHGFAMPDWYEGYTRSGQPITIYAIEGQQRRLSFFVRSIRVEPYFTIHHFRLYFNVYGLNHASRNYRKHEETWVTRAEVERMATAFNTDYAVRARVKVKAAADKIYAEAQERAYAAQKIAEEEQRVRDERARKIAAKHILVKLPEGYTAKAAPWAKK
jgi:hypothetical protein